MSVTRGLGVRPTLKGMGRLQRLLLVNGETALCVSDSAKLAEGIAQGFEGFTATSEGLQPGPWRTLSTAWAHLPGAVQDPSRS